MATHVSLASHFRQISIASSPKSFGSSRLFNRPATTSGSNLAQEVQRLGAELNQQSQIVSDLTSAVTGNPAALASTAKSLLGGSVLCQLAGSVTGGSFSWQSLLKDVLPLGGLVSEIAGLFSSSPVPAPLQQYDAPVPLGFSGVLASDGKISQASGGESGTAR